MRIKRIIALLVSVLSVSLMAAQNRGTFTVTLKDSQTDEPVGFATVSLTKSGEQKPYKYALTDSEGHGTIEKVSAGKYMFKAEIMGYKTYTKDVELGGDFAMGTVKMDQDKQVLDAASVSATGNPIIIKKDTIEYNASSFKTTDNDMLEDLLKKLPGVEVSEDGTVTANGQTITKITIDGKTFFLDDPQLASKNLPAKIIEKVKVVQKKSEQAEFTGIDDGEEETIIDLNIQKGMMNGMFGNVSLGGGHDILDNKTTSFGTNSGDYRYQGGAFIGKFTDKQQISLILNGNNTNNRGFNDLAGNMMSGMRGGGGGMGRGQGGWGGGNGITRSWMGGLNGAWDLFDGDMSLGGNYLYNNTNRSVQERSYKRTAETDGSYIINREGIDSPGVNVTNSYGNRFGMRLEHKFSENTSILFQPQVNFGGGDYHEFSDFETLEERGGIQNMQNKGFSNNTGANKNWSTNGFFLFRQRLGIPGRTISFMGNYNFSNNDLDGFTQSLTESSFGGETMQDIVNQRIDRSTKSSSLFGRLVYTEPLGKGFYASANYSYRWSKNQSIKDAYNSGEVNLFSVDNIIYNRNGETKDETYSSDILNTYNNQSAGVDLQYQKDKLHAQVGFSVMPTKTHNVTNGKEYDSDVINYAPSAMFWYDFSDNSNARFFYRGRSSQPSTTQLMPVPDNSNPTSISLGNPDLRPYFNHGFRGEFRLTNKKSFMSLNANLEGSLVQDPIVSAMWHSKGVQYTFPVNGPNSGNGSLRLFFNMPIAKSNFSLFLMNRTSYSFSTSYVGQTGLDMSKYLDENGTFTKYDVFLKDYPDLTHSADFAENVARTFGIMQRARITYRTDNIEIMAGGRTRMNRSTYTLETAKDLKTWNNQIDGSVNLTLPGGFTVKASADYNWYRGYTTPQEDEIIVNAEINKLLFKDKFTLAVRGYDLLNQAKNLSVSDSNGVYRETWNNTLGRYIIVALTYRFGTFGGHRGGMRMGPGGRGPGGPPMR